METRLPVGAISGVARRMRFLGRYFSYTCQQQQQFECHIQTTRNRRSFIRPRNDSDSCYTISYMGSSCDRYVKQHEYLQRRHSSGTTSIPQPPPDYWTNDGIIEGVWIFTRHGDRTPSRPLTPIHRRAEEAAFWMTKLPTPDSYDVFQSYSKYFPVSIQQPPIPTQTPDVNSNTTHPHQPHVFRDVALNPFGFITSKGLQQLADNGQRFYNRYNVHGHHTPQCTLFRTPKDFLTTWDVQVYSTNYLRTVMSIQSFLDGLFHTQCFRHGPASSSSENEQNQGDRMYDPNIIKEERIPSIAMSSLDTPLESTSEAYATVHVRDIHCDPLNAFDRNPTLISELVSEVMSTPDFLMRDGKATSLAARLANILPGLVRKSKKTTNDFSKHAPSRINWVEAADHFICRDAHNLSLSKFSDYEAQEEYEQTLQAMSHTTLAHLSWRFRKWYQHERLLALIAAPPLREISNQMMQTPQLSATARRPFVLYSCHDITILGLLYAIGADFLAIDNLNDTDTLNHTSGDDTGSWRYWPRYGSNLVFELVRVRDGPPGPDSHVVRVLLDGVPIRSSKINGLAASRNDATDSRGPQGMFFIHDFEQLVSKLEEAGGYDYASLLGQKIINLR